MIFYVYMLKSVNNKIIKTYVGYTNNLNLRLKKHNTSKGAKATRGFKWKIIYKKRLDPRLYNGAIFIGLDSPVVKSHGGTDFIGFSNSLEVCSKIVKGDLINKIRENI